MKLRTPSESVGTMNSEGPLVDPPKVEYAQEQGASSARSLGGWPAHFTADAAKLAEENAQLRVQVAKWTSLAADDRERAIAAEEALVEQQARAAERIREAEEVVDAKNAALTRYAGMCSAISMILTGGNPNVGIADLKEALSLHTPGPDYWRCKTCGCVWRDNHDGTVSLGSAKQTSCALCEDKTDQACEPLFRSPASLETFVSQDKLKQFGSLWVQAITAVDYRDGKAKTYDLVFIKVRGRFRLNHIYPHVVVELPVAKVAGGRA